MKPFTVIGVWEENWQIVSHHVEAENDMHAFAAVAKDEPGLSMVCALPGHVMEGNGITFPGDSLVGGDTFLSQPEVFGSPLES